MGNLTLRLLASFLTCSGCTVDKRRQNDIKRACILNQMEDESTSAKKKVTRIAPKQSEKHGSIIGGGGTFLVFCHYI